MRKLLLACLAAIWWAAPAAAQRELHPLISLNVAAPTRAVYVAALDALESRGYTLRVRMLDELLITLPRFRSLRPAPDQTAPQLYVKVGAEGDSTRLMIQAFIVGTDGRPLGELKGAADDERLARVLAAEVEIYAAMDTVLMALAPGEGGMDPREESDLYGYGRGNPVRTGGEEDGAARQRAWLDRLRGPAGERIRYRRLGACCQSRSPQGEITGMLDAYAVTYAGLERPVVLYLDMYSSAAGTPPAPEGLTIEPAGSPAAPTRR